MELQRGHSSTYVNPPIDMLTGVQNDNLLFIINQKKVGEKGSTLEEESVACVRVRVWRSYQCCSGDGITLFFANLGATAIARQLQLGHNIDFHHGTPISIALPSTMNSSSELFSKFHFICDQNGHDEQLNNELLLPSRAVCIRILFLLIHAFSDELQMLVSFSHLVSSNVWPPWERV